MYINKGDIVVPRKKYYEESCRIEGGNFYGVDCEQDTEFRVFEVFRNKKHELRIATYCGYDFPYHSMEKPFESSPVNEREDRIVELLNSPIHFRRIKNHVENGGSLEDFLVKEHLVALSSSYIGLSYTEEELDEIFALDYDYILARLGLDEQVTVSHTYRIPD